MVVHSIFKVHLIFTDVMALSMKAAAYGLRYMENRGFFQGLSFCLISGPDVAKAHKTAKYTI